MGERRAGRRKPAPLGSLGVFGSALIAGLDGAAGMEWHRIHLAWPFWVLPSIIGCQSAFQSVLERRYTRLRARLEEIERHRDPRYIAAVARARLTADVASSGSTERTFAMTTQTLGKPPESDRLRLTAKAAEQWRALDIYAQDRLRELLRRISGGAIPGEPPSEAAAVWRVPLVPGDDRVAGDDLIIAGIQ